MIKIIEGDSLCVLKTMAGGSVQCCVTSPPYWGLRDYGVAGQLGLEKTPEAYVAKMVQGFREVRRVLREDGVLFLNLGDSYARNGGTPGGGNRELMHLEGTQRRMTSIPANTWKLKEKDLCGIPWRVAFALQADGWWLRQDIIWHKPNPMPESVTDRCTKAHEYIFLLTKSSKYFYDAEAVKESAVVGFNGSTFTEGKTALNGEREGLGMGPREDNGTRNKRSVWTVPSAPYSEAHFATFPPDLIKPCILAGTSARGCCPKCGAPWERTIERVDEGYDGSRYGERALAASGGVITGGTARRTLGSSNGKLTGKTETTGWTRGCECSGPVPVPCTVLDPFGGSGTTGMVALELGRKAILIELNPEYVKLSDKRTFVTPGLALA